eukprot:1158106-Pelagomonas_calceolata.AAC.7
MSTSEGRQGMSRSIMSILARHEHSCKASGHYSKAHRHEQEQKHYLGGRVTQPVASERSWWACLPPITWALASDAVCL